MKPVLAALFAMLLLAGCNSTQSQQDRMLIGAGLGAATGATVGAIAGSSVGSSLAGAAIGAVGGGLIGAITAPQNCIAHDPQGVAYSVPCP